MRCSPVLAVCKWLVTFAGLCLIPGMPSALAANYEFLAAPETALNRVYRLDRMSGEIGACQYGAGPQTPSEYSLISSRHEREGGIFRIDMRTGNMSICYS
jgi:hypothetical protein